MPITVYGDTPAKLILPQDRTREKPRTLLVRMLSKKEVRAWQRKLDQADHITDLEHRDKAYDECLAEVVAGWENITGDFAVELISERYSLEEFFQVLNNIPRCMTIGPDDLKK